MPIHFLPRDDSTLLQETLHDRVVNEFSLPVAMNDLREAVRGVLKDVDCNLTEVGQVTVLRSPSGLVIVRNDKRGFEEGRYIVAYPDVIAWVLQ